MPASMPRPCRYRLALLFLLCTLLCCLLRGGIPVRAQAAPQAVGIAVGGDNLTRLLWNNPDGSVSLWRINSDGSVTSYTYGQFPDYTPLSLAVGFNNAPRILWNKPSISNNLLMNILPDGNFTGGFFGTGYYPPSAGYSPLALAVDANNLACILWNRPADNSAILWKVAADYSYSSVTYNNPAGPHNTPPGYLPVALAVGFNNAPRMLWTNSDHTALLWNILPDGNFTSAIFGLGYYPPSAGYTAIALTVDANNLGCILWSRSTDNTVILWRVAADYSFSNFTYSDPSGFTPKALAGGSDGKVRLLWTKPDGTAQVWVIAADGTYTSTTYSPYLNGLRIDAGSSSAYTDTSGKRWALDYGFSGGTTTSTSTAISSTSDPTLYQMQRTGSAFSYTLSVPNGNYVMDLLFAEIEGKTTGQRVFTVTTGGRTLLDHFDIAGAVGQNAATTRVFTVPVTNGQLTLNFTGNTGNAALAGLLLAAVPSSGGILPSLPGQSDAAPDIPAPGWAEDMTPTDASSDADGLGPSSAGPVNLASGVEENDPGADLGAYNPVGPSVTYERRYRSARAKLGYGSPGLSPGWTDNYDLFVTPKSGGYTLTYDNGATEAWTGGTGSLGTPSGAPYLVSVAPDLSTLTMTFKDRSKYIFTYFPAAGGNYGPDTFLLTNITNLVGRSVTINRDTALRGYRILSITNDASTPLTLLSFVYDGSGRLSAVSDAYTRQIGYGYDGGNNLATVTQINSTAPLWQYGYLTLFGHPFLSSVQTPDPSNVGGLATSLTDYYDNGTVAIHQDAVGRVRSYGYQNAGSKTFIQANNADGSLAEAWTQKNLTLGGMNTDGGTIDAASKADSIAYGGMSSPYLPSAATNRNNQTAQVTYFDHYGNVLSVTSPRNVVTTYTYGNPTDFALNQVSSVTQIHLNSGGTQDGSKEATQFSYYGPSDGVFNGLLHTVVSPKPDTTVSLNPSTVPTTYSYTNLGNVVQTTAPGPNSTVGISGSYTIVLYNYTSDSYTDPGGTLHSYSQAEALGQPLSVTVSGPDAFGATTSTVTHYRYNARGDRTAVIDALGIETDFAYNLAGQLTAVAYPATNNSGTGRTQTTTAYQYLGGPASGTSVFDETGNLFRQVAYIYGPEGELLTTTGNAYPVLYSYDGRGRVRAVTYYQTSVMDSHTTFYDYDPEGRLADVRYPNQSGANFDKLQYLYDADGNMTQEIDGVGVTKTYTRTDPESLLTGISYTYPTGYSGTKIGSVTFGYDNWGRQTTVANDANTKTYAYDDLDELTGQTTLFGTDPYQGTPGPASQQITYQHSPDGSRSHLSIPNTNNGNDQAYYYDGVGRLAGTYIPYSGQQFAYSYLPNGWLSATQSLYAPSNPTTPTPYLEVDRTYNARGFLQTLTNRLLTNPSLGTTAAPLSAFAGMTYDPNGNRLTEVSSVPARGQAPDLSRAVQYKYDGLDELTQETSTPANGSFNTGYNHTFAYDLSGNPTSPRLSGTAFNTDNQFTSSVSLYNGASTAIAYNGNGDPLTLPFYSFTTAAGYDPEDRLETTGNPNAPSAYSRYDADGLRAWNYATLLGVSYFLNDGIQPIEEDYTGNGGDYNLFGATGLELRFTVAGGSPTYQKLTAYTYDPQGNLVQPVALFPGDPLQVRVEGSAAYDGFGMAVAQKVAEGQFDGYSFAYEPFGFGGQYGYYTDNSGLVLLTHRYYNPVTGEFVNRDPIGYGGGINLYGLAGNNPVNRSDTSGFKPDPDDPTGLPGDNDGHWGGRTGHPGMQRGTAQSNTARRMTRSLVSTLWDAALGIFNLEGKAAEVAAERVIIPSVMHTLNLSSTAWRRTKFAQEGLVYILKDATTGEALKVGQTTSGKFLGRFEKYVTAGNRNGRNLALEVFETPLAERGKVEGALRKTFGLAPKLPWDNSGRPPRLGRPGRGVP